MLPPHYATDWMPLNHYDKIILGGGLYGLYAAEHCGRYGQSILVLEYDNEPFSRATYVNQARVHQGYHYPRSLHTALKSAHYFRRFNEDYGFCINRSFRQIYGISSEMSWTNAKQFKGFCKAADILCEETQPARFFRNGLVDAAYITEEYTYDARMLRDYLIAQISTHPNIEIKYGSRISRIERTGDEYQLTLEDGSQCATGFLLNTTYASVNQILSLCDIDLFDIKYELCEIALCTTTNSLRDVGITVMDGPFFSLMPFGKTGLHSLTSVSFTPHQTCHKALPHFDCQSNACVRCDAMHLDNCNICPAKPTSAFEYMSQLAKKYLLDEYGFAHKDSLYSVKPILQASEIDDSRPTVIRQHSTHPTFVSVLSGKINTIYDLDEVLDCD